MKRIIIMAENKTGVLADVSQALANDGINIETLDTGCIDEKGIIILTSNDSDKALHTLKNAGFRAITDDALIIRLPDEPGALAKIAEKFKQAGIGIRSLHILNRHGGHSMVALTADNRDQAEALIGDEFIV